MRLLSLLFLIFTICLAYDDDPYSILGISRRSSPKEIKRAYKEMAREWHPDKNDNPEAQDKFVAISKAYDILSTPEKKERYDKFGTMDDSPRQYGGGYHDFFKGHDDSGFAKHRISMREYMHSILEKSHERPYIIYAYSNYCNLCFSLQNQWKAVVADLEPLGYGIGTVNAMMDGNLVEKLRISHLPSIVAVVEGRVIHYRDDMIQLTERSVRMFARDVIPRTFLPSLNTYDKIKRFIDQWQATNKVSILILGAAREPRTRYLLTAMKYSHFARFAYVHLGEETVEIESLRNALSIKCTQCENILIFNDVPENGPIARVSVSNINQLSNEALTSLIEKNKMLSVPKLSSTQYLDEVCPVSSRTSRVICVLLPLEGEETEALDAWKQYVKKAKHRYAQMQVRFAYVDSRIQYGWLQSFVDKKPADLKVGLARKSLLYRYCTKGRGVLVLWRFELVKAKFMWIPMEENKEAAFDQLLTDVVASKTRLETTATVGQMENEYAPSWWTRWCRALVRTAEIAFFHLRKEETYAVLSVIGTILALLVMGFFLNYLNTQSVHPKKDKKKHSDWHPDDPTTPSDQPKQANPQAKVQRIMSIMNPITHELRAESYFGMIRLLKPGCRSLIVLVDEENKERILKQFAQYVFPLRNNKTFSFGYLMVEKNLPWFRKLLEHTLPAETAENAGETMYTRLKGINPRQTIGTVLVLCGWKLYFSIYHPMHTIKKGKKNFLGFDDEDGDTSDSDYDDSDNERAPEKSAMLNAGPPRLIIDNVLNGFPNWLDRLLEGSTRRYYIPEWPDNLH